MDHPRTVPAQRLVATLNFAPRAHSLHAPSNMRCLRLVATDVDWSHGAGSEVTGPAEALLMVLVGREPGLVDLAGPGLPILTKRVTTH
ncbi:MULTISPECIES: hypothetical protein [unclassified Rhodococcus (in: high G+C Gram-positive bacteria)]|uniref:hypothetical protein n=1 Tax=unclassified Rhodococcus (in: high G+C Gram-positive bacteria) TaxID=192944 RepID=UPI001FFBAAF9|nr:MULTISPECIES: hypothetical protein [unclassified Rhodococcus (in: high G+C Gram-positive bacteria)]